jgi:hypothetical protein
MLPFSGLLHKPEKRCVVEPPGNSRQMEPAFSRQHDGHTINNFRSTQPLNELSYNIKHSSLNARIKNIVMAAD